MRTEDSGTSLFTKAFSIVAGAGTALGLLLAVALLVLIGVPTALCVGSCAGIAGVGGAIGEDLERAAYEDLCLQKDLPRDCWITKNQQCLDEGEKPTCWF
jgi:hypothetical protein